MIVLKLARFSRKANALMHVAFIAALLIAVVPLRVDAASILLASRYDKISDSTASAVATHEFGFVFTELVQPIGSISFEFCSNSPIVGDTCDAPVGLSALDAVLADQTGEIDFTVHASSTVNRIVLSRTAVVPVGVPSTYTFDDITNPSTSGSQYVRIQTFESEDGTGVDIESGGVVYAIQPGLSISSEVPPYIRFCAGTTIVGFDCSTANAYFIDMGLLSTGATNTGSSQFLVATNAATGYSVTVNGKTMTSGNNEIPPLVSPTASSVGTSQFGINLRANTSPSVGQNAVGQGSASPSAHYNNPNTFKFAAGDVLVGSSQPDYNRKFTVSYIANIGAAQKPGVYATTISYICLANF